MQKVVSDPFTMGQGGVMVLNECTGRLRPEELALRGDYPKSLAQMSEDGGRLLQLFAIPLAVLIIGASVALTSLFPG